MRVRINIRIIQVLRKVMRRDNQARLIVGLSEILVGSRRLLLSVVLGSREIGHCDSVANVNSRLP